MIFQMGSSKCFKCVVFRQSSLALILVLFLCFAFFLQRLLFSGCLIFGYLQYMSLSFESFLSFSSFLFDLNIFYFFLPTISLKVLSVVFIYFFISSNLLFISDMSFFFILNYFQSCF